MKPDRMITRALSNSCRLQLMQLVCCNQSCITPPKASQKDKMGETDSCSGCVLLTIFVQQRLRIWPIFSLQLWYIQIRPCAWLWLKECPTQGKLGKQSVSWTALDICSQNRKYSPKTWGSLKSPYTHTFIKTPTLSTNTHFFTLSRLEESSISGNKNWQWQFC